GLQGARPHRRRHHRRPGMRRAHTQGQLRELPQGRALGLHAPGLPRPRHLQLRRRAVAVAAQGRQLRVQQALAEELRGGRRPDVLERFAFDNICRVAFGEDPACLAEEGMAAPESAEFMAAFNDAQNTIMARFMSPAKWLWRVKRLLDMEPERRMRSALATIHGYADKIVRERKERGEAGLASRDDFLSRFAAAGEHSDESLRDVVTNFILAGRDTTSSALTWFFWLVSTRPDVEDKITRE
uniref:Cytochrome P450 94A1 n=1 Tax=Aegilops tauschii subsp. strangulata TaxID=200361 RepID=A0A453FR70_AEGTS